ncbi:hypothetical protein [Nocardiopsis sp. FIRDI 009]|uniref:hypothetical protein n=1 Tax=Nocardiopsis sp. FIRDI 009 TaxID=714197 RepID=UPI000E267BCC|nr:hypothetical protein [Nocardiopsis sp. FIRDI 009]
MVEDPNLHVALVNIQDGGRGYDRVAEFVDPLFAPVTTPPGVVVVNEATGWRNRGMRRGLDVAHHLRTRYGPAYQLLVGHLDRSDHPPAILYDPDVLTLREWRHPTTNTTVASHNLATFTTRWGELSILPQHWHPWDANTRLHEAHQVRGVVANRPRVMVVGDLNSTCSGPGELWPRKDWDTIPVAKRHEKGWQPGGPEGAWEPRTDALDHLIGTWNPTTGTRVGGAGLATVVELDWQRRGCPPGDRFAATTNTPPERGGGMVIDHGLLTRDLWETVVAGSYQVHVPPAGRQVSDHRLVTWTLRLDQTGADAAPARATQGVAR